MVDNRDKRDAEERLAVSENYCKSKDVLLDQLQQELEKTRNATPDVHVLSPESSDHTKIKIGVLENNLHDTPDVLHQDRITPIITNSTRGFSGNAVTRADILLSKITQSNQGSHFKTAQTRTFEAFDNARNSFNEKSARASSTALERLKQRMTRDIQTQIAITR